MFDTEIKPNQPAIECVYQDNYGDEPHNCDVWIQTYDHRERIPDVFKYEMRYYI
jgi:hypothetical protein